MLVTVLVPTYRRVSDLNRCLEALKQQSRAPDEVVIVVRDSDAETWAFLQQFHVANLPLTLIKVDVPGQVAALNAGITYAKGEVIAITDDDAAPHPNWLEKIEHYFLTDRQLGGLGGRDRVHQSGTVLDCTVCEVVGRVQWFGRTIGNHHSGTGKARSVDILKGANMSYRRSAIEGLKFNELLRGAGAQAHNDLAFSLSVKKNGWKLIYDPEVTVDHFPAQRFDEDGREQFSAIATANMVHNETFIILDYLLPRQRPIYLLWALLVGTRPAFGLVQLLRFFPQEGCLALRKWQSAMQGRWKGWQTWQGSNAKLLKS